MTKQPEYLKKGDKIAIVCPAKKLKAPIDNAVAILEQWGLEVITGKTVTATHNQFAGDDTLRTEDLQFFLDDPAIKAIIAGRGGYGTIRVIDEINFNSFNEQTKWLVGFSDISVLLSHAYAALNTQSIHGQMPGTFNDATPESLETLRKALFGETISHTYSSNSVYNRIGETEGTVIGGNLSILVSLEGSISEMDYSEKILFLEDVGEYDYSIDRMMRQLKRSGKLAKLKGLIIGAFNETKTEDIPFGQTTEQIIFELVKDYDYPVCFDFPTGHIADNRAMIVGRSASLKVDENHTTLLYI